MKRKAVSDWDVLVHKNVRASDGEPVGNVVAILDDSVQVEIQDRGVSTSYPSPM